MFQAPEPAAQKRDAERIRDFILEHKPHVLLVGGANMACRQLKAELTAVRDYILETIPHFFTRCGGLAPSTLPCFKAAARRPARVRAASLEGTRSA